MLKWDDVGVGVLLTAEYEHFKEEHSRVMELAESSQPIFGGEPSHRSDPRHRSRKIIRLCTDLMAFCAPGLIAIASRQAFGDISTLTAIIMVVEIALVLILATQIVVHADLARDRSWSAADDDNVSITREAER